MKKFVALILAVLTCVSFTACFGGGSKYDYSDTWDILAFTSNYDYKGNQSVQVRGFDIIVDWNSRSEGTLGSVYTIEENGTQYITLGGSTKTYEPSAVNTEKLKLDDNQVYTSKYERHTGVNVNPFGETVMLARNLSSINGANVSNILLRRSSLGERMDPVKSLIADENLTISFDAILGQYASTRVFWHNGQFDEYFAFSSKVDANTLTISKDGDAVKFVDGANKSWTVESASVSTYYLGGIQVNFTNGTEKMIITILEVGESTISYIMNKADDASKVLNYGLLEKK